MAKIIFVDKQGCILNSLRETGEGENCKTLCIHFATETLELDKGFEK
jgi:hypothetical protein